MILSRSSLPNYYHLLLVAGGWLWQKVGKSLQVLSFRHHTLIRSLSRNILAVAVAAPLATAVFSQPHTHPLALSPLLSNPSNFSISPRSVDKFSTTLHLALSQLLSSPNNFPSHPEVHTEVYTNVHTTLPEFFLVILQIP